MFELVRSMAGASGSLRQAYMYITGGVLAEALIVVGDSFSRSATDHLRQAQRSTNPIMRIHQAAGDMQNAYSLYETSLRRGVPSLKKVVAFSKFAEGRDKAAGAAAAVALMQWAVAESPHNVREWLDRARVQIWEYDREYIANKKLRRDYYVDDSDLNFYIIPAIAELERNLLPDSMRRLPFVATHLHGRPYSDRNLEGWKQFMLKASDYRLAFSYNDDIQHASVRTNYLASAHYLRWYPYLENPLQERRAPEIEARILDAW